MISLTQKRSVAKWDEMRANSGLTGLSFVEDEKRGQIENSMNIDKAASDFDYEYDMNVNNAQYQYDGSHPFALSGRTQDTNNNFLSFANSRRAPQWDAYAHSSSNERSSAGGGSTMQIKHQGYCNMCAHVCVCVCVCLCSFVVSRY